MPDNDDHLSPEPLENYEEFKVEDVALENQHQEPTAEEQYKTENLDVAGPFRKIDLEWQKKQLENPTRENNLTPDGVDYTSIKQGDRDFNMKQITYRERVLEFNRDKAKSAFTTVHEGKKLDFDR